MTGRDRFGHRARARVDVVVANAPSFPSALGSASLARDLHDGALGLAD